MKFLLKFMFLALNGLCFGTPLQFNNAEEADQRIIGGSDAQRYEFPYVVSIQIDGIHYCGGSLNLHSWVITTASCIYQIPLNQTKVVAGMLNLYENHTDVQKVSVAKAIVHPHFNPVTLDNDIGLLQLSTPLKLTKAVQAAYFPLPKAQFYEGTFAGWGVKARPVLDPKTLQRLKMEIISNEMCEYLLSKFKSQYKTPQLIKSMFCTAPPTGLEEVCYGDGGHSISDGGIVIGVASWAPACANYNVGAPSVFTAVSQFIDFLDKHAIEPVH